MSRARDEAPSSSRRIHRRAELVFADGEVVPVLVAESPPEELRHWTGDRFELDAIRSGDGIAVYREIPSCPTTSSRS